MLTVLRECLVELDICAEVLECMQFKYPPEKQLHILDRIAWSEMFESYLANKYTAAKRFGLEGCETLIPGMKALIDRAADEGVETVVFGMPHRGPPACHTHASRQPVVDS